MPTLLDKHGLDGIEPAISCVTGRRVNRYTTRPKMVTPTGLEPCYRRERAFVTLDQGAVLKHKIDYSIAFILKTRTLHNFNIFYNSLIFRKKEL